MTKGFTVVKFHHKGGGELKRGDRRDAKRVRDLDPMHQFMPYIMPKRCDSEVYIAEKVDVTEALDYIKTRNGLNYKMTLFHVILAAFSKTIVHRPYLNRFVSGRRFYERNQVSFSFIIKKQFSDKGQESIMILKTDGDSTLEQISCKVVEEVSEIREKGQNDLDGLLNYLVRLPRGILRMFASLLFFLEYHNAMPEFLSKMDPYYTTVLIANLGSIKCGAPYHHLVEYGTNSIMVTVGELYEETKQDPQGIIQIRSFVDIGITLDERIGDGFYFAKSIKLLKYLISKPNLLEARFIEEVNCDE